MINTEQAARAFITEFVRSNYCVRGVTLAAELAARGWEHTELIYQMAKAGELVEVEYTLTFMNYRTKSVFFPKDTVINVIKKEG